MAPCSKTRSTNSHSSASRRSRFLRDNPLGFWISSMMAGIYVGFGILLIFSIGSALDPSVRPLAMGASFGLALILVIFAGSDLFTGHTMSLTISGLQGGTSWNNVLTIWAVSWLGNLAGALLLAALVCRRRRRADHQRGERARL
jgi:nitrite transporter NirC